MHSRDLYQHVYRYCEYQAKPAQDAKRNCPAFNPEEQYCQHQQEKEHHEYTVRMRQRKQVGYRVE